MMVYESIHRLLKPEDILYNQAILVAVIGLIVNGASMLILGHEYDLSATGKPTEMMRS